MTNGWLDTMNRIRASLRRKEPVDRHDLAQVVVGLAETANIWPDERMALLAAAVALLETAGAEAECDRLRAICHAMADVMTRDQHTRIALTISGINSAFRPAKAAVEEREV